MTLDEQKAELRRLEILRKNLEYQIDGVHSAITKISTSIAQIECPRKVGEAVIYKAAYDEILRGVITHVLPNEKGWMLIVKPDDRPGEHTIKVEKTK